MTSALVLLKYRAQRTKNLLATGLRRKKTTQRTANARKGTQGWVSASFLFLFITYSSGFQSLQLIKKTIAALEQTQIVDGQQSYPAWECAKPGKGVAECLPVPRETTGLISDPVSKAVSISLIFLFLSVFLMNISSKELTAPEWDLEWLATLPIPLSKLIGIRIMERTIVNPTGLLIIWPFITVLLWHTGFGLFSIPLAIVSALLILFFEAIFRTLVDTGLRMVISPSRLRNMQALTSLGASVALLLVLSISFNERPALLSWSLSPYVTWVLWTPMGLVIRALTANSISMSAELVAILGLQIAATYFLAARLLLHLLRFGLVKGGSREGVKRVAKTTVYATGKSIFLPLQRRELKLLARDRNFMVQTLVMPVFITGMQFFLQGTKTFAGMFQGNFKLIAATAFGAATYSLIFSAFQVLNSEGKSLWILYTFPNRLENLLRQKVYLWLAIALIYPLIIFSIGIYFNGVASFESIVLIVIVLLGIVIYSSVAACLGVFASDPLSEEPRQRQRIDLTYLYMTLAGFYTYAIFAKSYWSKCVLLVLSALMSLALFQKVKDHLPFLLDPTESPKSSVSLADGLIAALMFFVIQGIATVFQTAKDHELTGRDLLMAFSIAGAITFTAMRFIYWRKKTIGVPRIFGAALPQALGYGVLCGVAAGIIGTLYLKTISHYGLFSESLSQAIDAEPLQGQWWIIVLTVIAAPVFEEFIFRGIIFKGLSRTWSIPMAAIASAAIFAIVHPPISVIPVFGLAVIAALGYSRTNLLITPMIAHSVYNFIVLFSQARGT